MQQLIRFKKDEARNVVSQALNLKLPFDEIDLMEENLEVELIRRQLVMPRIQLFIFVTPTLAFFRRCDLLFPPWLGFCLLFCLLFLLCISSHSIMRIASASFS